VLTSGDVAAPALTFGLMAGLVVGIIPAAAVQGMLPLHSPFTWALLAGILIFIFLWTEGRRQIQFQRPRGIVVGEFLFLVGAYQLLQILAFSNDPAVPHGALAIARCGLAMVGGGIIIAVIVPRFLKQGEERAILERISDEGESVQEEYTPPTPECPNPELWRMVDSQSSELEVLDFLKCMVTTVKPRLIVETGTFLGYGTLKMAEGLKENGFGHIITIEYDPVIFAKAKERIEASGLASWIECRNGSSLDATVEGTIDILYSDSALSIREQEVRRFLPQIEPRGLIMMHDASSHYEVVREGALRLEQEGLISVVLLPTPRGLVIAQKREGRK
jgi:predicted O-methyltransferase YrrM